MRTGRPSPEISGFILVARLLTILVLTFPVISCSGAAVRTEQPSFRAIAMVSFVFDDGNDTDYLVGREIFADHGAVASSAVTSDFLNTEDHMTSAQIFALQKSGWEIMGHTVSHPNLKSLSPQGIEDELSRSKTELERLGLNVRNIVYPYNKNDETVRDITGKHYRSGRGGTNSFNTSDMDPFFIRSFAMKHDVERMKGLIDTAHRERYWLVFYQHEIDAHVKVSDYDGSFIKGEKLILSPSGAIGRYVTTHWFPLYGYSVYLVPFTGVPRAGDTIRGEKSGATASVDHIIYNEREQLSHMLGYIKTKYPDMPIVTIDRGLDLLGVPKFAGETH